MLIFMHELDEREKGILNELNNLVPLIEHMYEDMEICLTGKDQVPLLKRCKEKRDRAIKSRDGFLNYLKVNGKAV